MIGAFDKLLKLADTNPFLYNLQAMQKNGNHLELQILKANPSLMILLKEGDLVDVALMERGGRAAYFEIPKIGTGVVYGVEFLNAKGILKFHSVDNTGSNFGNF